jgi:hypothetical protein
MPHLREFVREASASGEPSPRSRLDASALFMRA